MDSADVPFDAAKMRMRFAISGRFSSSLIVPSESVFAFITFSLTVSFESSKLILDHSDLADLLIFSFAFLRLITRVAAATMTLTVHSLRHWEIWAEKRVETLCDVARKL